MKKITKIVLLLIVALNLAGCVGVITGHEYTKNDFVIMYKVVKSGVVTFMTPEQIEKYKLNKADLVVTDTYKLVEKKDVPTK